MAKDYQEKHTLLDVYISELQISGRSFLILQCQRSQDLSCSSETDRRNTKVLEKSMTSAPNWKFKTCSHSATFKSRILYCSLIYFMLPLH